MAASILRVGVGLCSGVLLWVSPGLGQVAREFYWSDASEIRRLGADGTITTEALARGEGTGTALALDLPAGQVYWTSDTPAAGIYRADLDGRKAELVRALSDSPVGLAVVGGMVFWTERGSGEIRVSSLDGMAALSWVRVADGFPEGLALDLAGGQIYWTVQGAVPGASRIQRAALGGPNSPQTLVKFPANVHAAAIALDLDGGKLYWSERSSGDDRSREAIRRRSLDGTGSTETVIALPGGSPGALALDSSGRKIYWMGADGLGGASFDGANVETLVSGVTARALAVDSSFAFAGLRHLAQGRAKLAIEDHSLVVSGGGSSRDDDVELLLGEAEFGVVALGSVSLEPGQALSATAFGTLDGIAGQALATINATGSPAGTTTRELDLSPAAGGAREWIVYDGPSVVFSGAIPGSAV